MQHLVDAARLEVRARNAVLAGVPEIVGARFVVDVLETEIVNGASVRVALPSVTLIVMLGDLPVFQEFGVPQIAPVFVENESQPGLPLIANLSTSPFESLAVGLNQ